MALEERIVTILQKYKYSNVPLETTMKSLVVALGYDDYKEIREGDFAQNMCLYKWNRLTKEELIYKVKNSDYLYRRPTNTPLTFDYGSYGA